MATRSARSPTRVATVAEKKAAPVRCHSFAAKAAFAVRSGVTCEPEFLHPDLTNLANLPDSYFFPTLPVTMTSVRGPQSNVDQIKDLLRKRAELKVSPKDTGVAEALRFLLLTCLFCRREPPQEQHVGEREGHTRLQL